MIISRKTAVKLVDELKMQGKKVVFTNGCFDILHIGHLRYLEEAKKLGDILIVGLNSDKSVRAIKGSKRPINAEMDRAEMVSGLKPVDFTVIFDETDPIAILNELKPTIHVKGGDYKIAQLPETSTVQKNGGEVIILPYVEGRSTTGIVNKIQFNGKKDKNDKDDKKDDKENKS